MRLDLTENRLSTSATDLKPAVEAHDLLNKVGQTATIEGAVLNIREMKWGGFIVLRTPTSTIQVVVSTDQLSQFKKGDFVTVKGEVKSKKSKTGIPEIEISCGEVKILSSSQIEPSFDVAGLN